MFYRKKFLKSMDPDEDPYILSISVEQGAYVYIVFNPGTREGTCKLSLVNCSFTEAYHPVKQFSRKVKYLGNIVLDNIPLARASDEAFWILLTSNYLNAEIQTIYTVLIPWLLEKPLLDVFQEPYDWP